MALLARLARLKFTNEQCTDGNANSLMNQEHVIGNPNVQMNDEMEGMILFPLPG